MSAAVTIEELERRIVRLEAKLFACAPESPVKPDIGIYPLILKAVADAYRLSIPQLVSQSRMQHIAEARFMGMHLARKLAHSSMNTIAMQFGRYDHGCVANGLHRADELIASDKQFALLVKQIEAGLRKKMEEPCA